MKEVDVYDDDDVEGKGNGGDEVSDEKQEKEERE